jgi:Fe-Mn family superoxide dismutase
MIHRLPELPWPVHALEPHMSARTLELHHGKHHAGYVEKLNQLIRNTSFANLDLDDIVFSAEGAIFNNAAQHWNHAFLWEGLRPAGGHGPSASLRAALDTGFGSIDAFREKFSAAAIGKFGSGWTWLVARQDGKLEIVSTGNAANPLRHGVRPLLACDVWEHAYYLDYQNRRGDYVAAFWSVVDWERVAERLGATGRDTRRRDNRRRQATDRP